MGESVKRKMQLLVLRKSGASNYDNLRVPMGPFRYLSVHSNTVVEHDDDLKTFF